MKSRARITVVAVPHVEVADDVGTGLRSDAIDEVLKLGEEGGDRLGVVTGRSRSIDNEQS